jgi:hypothetical protein
MKRYSRGGWIEVFSIFTTTFLFPKGFTALRVQLQKHFPAQQDHYDKQDQGQEWKGNDSLLKQIGHIGEERYQTNYDGAEEKVRVIKGEDNCQNVRGQEVSFVHFRQKIGDY